MKQLFVLFMTLVCCASCTGEDPYDEFMNPPGGGFPGGNFPGMNPGGMPGDMPGFGGQEGSVSAQIEGLTDFDVTFFKSTLSEKETIPAQDEDYIENCENDFVATVTIHYKGTDTPEISGTTDAVSVTADGGNVVATATKSCKFVLSGTSANGRFKLYSEKKSAVVLNGVNLTNPSGAALNIQSKKRTYLVLADGTENRLEDGSNYVTEYDPQDASSAEKQKGTYYSKGQTIISGSGKLTIDANYKHGIDTKDYLRIRPRTYLYIKSVAGNCIKCEDTDEDGGIIIEGGVLDLDNQATAGKGLSSDGEVTINGGRVTAICTGDGEWDGDDAEVKDVSGAAGIKTDGKFTLKGGDLWLKSTGKGGKGINGDSELQFLGGTVHVLTTGDIFAYQYNNQTYDTSPKGIKSDTDIVVDGAELFVQAIGNSDGSEGIEAKQSFTLESGKVMIYAADDALNTGYSSDGLREKQQLGVDISNLKANDGKVIINGGSLFAYSMGNDGVDSNGTIAIHGGTTFSFGSTAPEEGFDCDQNTFTITGGTVLGVGGASSNPTESACQQPCALITVASLVNGNTCQLTDSSGKELLSVLLPRNYNNATVLLSSSEMKKGGTYSFAGTSINCSSSAWVTGSAGFMGGGRR